MKKKGAATPRALNPPTTRCVSTIHALANRVMKALGTGHPERVYHRALITGLNSKRILHRSEVLTPVHFMGDVVGVGRCDLVLNGLIVEIKANRQHPRRAGAQLKKYIQSMVKTESRQYSGIVINFNQKLGRVQTWEGPTVSAEGRPRK